MPPELEMALAPDGRMRLADLVEEELLLAMPGAPLHDEERCPAATGDDAPEEVEGAGAAGRSRNWAGC